MSLAEGFDPFLREEGGTRPFTKKARGKGLLTLAPSICACNYSCAPIRLPIMKSMWHVEF